MMSYRLLITLVAVAYLFINSIFFPSITVNASMIGEMSGVFYYEVNKFGFISSFLNEQCSYLDLGVRLAAAVPYVLNLPIKYAASAYAAIGLFAAIFYTLSFCHSDYRLLIKSDATRLLIATVVLFSYDYDTKVFQGFPYFSIFFTAFQLCYLFVNRAPNRTTWMLLITACDKPLMLIFLPFYFYLYNEKIWRKGALAGIFLMLLQISFILFTYANSTNGVCYNPSGQLNFSVIEKISAAFGYIFSVQAFFILGPYVMGFFGNSIQLSFLFGIILAIGFIIYAVNCENITAKIFIFSGILIIIFNAIILCVAFQNVWNAKFELVTSGGLYKMWRHIIPFYIGAIFQIVGLLLGLTFKKSHKILFFSLLAWFIFSGNGIRPIYEYKKIDFPLVGSGVYFDNLSIDELINDSRCVPVDPFPFVLKDSVCKVELNGNPWTRDYVKTNSVEIEDVAALFSNELEGAQVVGIGIISRSFNHVGLDYKLIIDGVNLHVDYETKFNHRDDAWSLIFIETKDLRYNFKKITLQVSDAVDLLKANSGQDSQILISMYFKK